MVLAKVRVDTPIRRQYQRLKAQHPGCLLLFQLGDFFESFEEDARTLARVCAVTLTSRELGKGDRVALAGVPLTRLEHYLARLVEAGVHVAIAEQTSPAGSGLVDREVTRVVTPGTLAEPGLLRERENNYLAAIARGRHGVGLAYADVTTGEFCVTEIDGDEAEARLRIEMERLGPSELLLVQGAEVELPTAAGARPPHVTVCQPWRFAEEPAREKLCGHLGVLSLEGFGCATLPLAVGAAGAILSYLEETNPRLLPNLTGLRTYATGGGMALDGYTRRNLELLRNGRTGRVEGSLLGALDRTRTPMGGRLLRRFVSQPLLDLAEITRRLDAVEALVNEDATRDATRALLGRIGDLERQVGRVAQGLATPRELTDLAENLRTCARLRGTLADRDADGEGVPDFLARASGEEKPYLERIARLDPCADVVELVARAVETGERGRRIRPGYCSELDAMVRAVSDARRWVASLEATERQRTGIRSLKVGFNKVFGYYLEVTRPNLGSVPKHYHRKQTLAGAERFVTPELRDREGEIAQAQERIEALEAELYEAVLARISAQGTRLRRLARLVAHVDVFAALADVARERGYCRPLVDAGDETEIVGGRHPVVEAGLEPGGFIPNDCHLQAAGSGDGPQVAILTGPNMAGKSTYLRQVAVIVLMAQIGSFVPARGARLGLVDRIFTRVGAQDDIAAGASTFMVEMMEAASILRHSTRRSLLVLDELGRGTSTFDGLSIARAVVEDVHDRLGARTLFATHFHEIARLEDQLARVRVYNAAVAEDPVSGLIFLRRIVPGGASRSFGIQVARLAGLPDGVTRRADQILAELEADAPQPADGRGDRVLAALRRMDPNALTPIEAIAHLAELRRIGGLE